MQKTNTTTKVINNRSQEFCEHEILMGISQVINPEKTLR